MSLDEQFDTILAAAREGAEWAWTRIYEDLAPTLLGYLRRLGAPDADGLVGDVMVRVVRGLPGFEGDEDGFRSWVFTIAHHRLIDDRRYRGRRPVHPAEREDLDAALPPTEHTERDALERASADDLARLLDVLTDDQREVLLLRLAGFTIAEVAGITGRNANATKALQRRALRSLERHLKSGGGPYPFGGSGRSP